MCLFLFSQIELLSQNGEGLAKSILYVVVAAVNDGPSVISPSHLIELDEDAGPTIIPGVYVIDPDVHETPSSLMEVCCP